MSFVTKEGAIWLVLLGILAVSRLIALPTLFNYLVIFVTVLYSGWYLKRCYNEAQQEHPEAFLAAYSKINGGK